MLFIVAGFRKRLAVSPVQMSKACKALERCLKAGKNELPQALAVGPTPFQFAEEWLMQGWKLNSYEVLGSQFAEEEVFAEPSN